MERFQEIRNRLLQLCEEREDIKAVLVIGSWCRREKGADEYSDLDLILVCDRPEELLYREEWVNRLGRVVCSFLEDTMEGQKERRVLFEGSLDVDFVIVDTEVFDTALKNHGIDGILGRGCQVLYDEGGFQSRIEQIPPAGQREYSVPDGPAFRNLVNDFYYHVVWTEKKLCRGEIWTAKMCGDAYLKNLLLRMMEWYEICRNGKNYEVWHDGRMLEQWAEEPIVQELKSCFAHYDREDIKKALEHTEHLFTRLARVCANAWNYTTGIPEVDSCF